MVRTASATRAGSRRLLKKARLLTCPTPARQDAPFRGQGRSECHFIMGGWDDPNCARRTSTFLSCAFRERGDRPSYPTPPFFSRLLVSLADSNKTYRIADQCRWVVPLSNLIGHSIPVAPLGNPQDFFRRSRDEARLREFSHTTCHQCAHDATLFGKL